jgi:hypothetical protein
MPTIRLPDGRQLVGTDVAISEQTERWTDVVLSDGSKLRIRPNVLSVTKIDGEYDPEGHPLYAIKSNNIMVVAESPAHLKRGANTGGGRAN